MRVNGLKHCYIVAGSVARPRVYTPGRVGSTYRSTLYFISNIKEGYYQR